MAHFITIGSCLAYNIGYYHSRLSNSSFLSSTRHNRIDKLVDTYFEKKVKELPYKYVLNLNFDRSNKDLIQLVDNQFSSRDLGKTSLDTQDTTGLIDTIENKDIDLVIYDNFVDILGKLLFAKEGKESFFINIKDSGNWQDLFNLESYRITIDLCVEYYEKLTKFFKDKNSKTKIIFVNFPLMHKHQMATTRVRELNQKFMNNVFLRKNSFFIPATPIPQEYFENVHHFQEYQGRNLYKDYALIVQLLVDNYYSHSEWFKLVEDKQDSLIDYINSSFPSLDNYKKTRYWLKKKAAEGGVLNNSWYLKFYTSYFQMDRSFYQNKKILDINCGPRGSLEWADQALERVGLDPIASSYLKLGTDKHKMKYVEASTEFIPFPDNYFDVISLFDSSDNSFVSANSILEVKRVLKFEGIILILHKVLSNFDVRSPSQISSEFDNIFLPEVEPLEKKYYELINGGYAALEKNVKFNFLDLDARGSISVLKYKNKKRE